MIKLKHLLHKLRMFFVYGFSAASTYEWDAQVLYKDINLRLRRLKQTFLDDGHTVWTEPDTKLMKRLSEAIELSDRLYNNDVDTRTVRHIQTYTYDRAQPDLFSECWEREHPRKMLPYKLYRVYFRKASEKDRADYNNMKRRFFHLLETYLEQWWD